MNTNNPGLTLMSKNIEICNQTLDYKWACTGVEYDLVLLEEKTTQRITAWCDFPDLTDV